MAEGIEFQIARYREEIARLEQTIVDVEQQVNGPPRYQILELLRASLALHRKAMAVLETERKGH